MTEKLNKNIYLSYFFVTEVKKIDMKDTKYPMFSETFPHKRRLSLNRFKGFSLHKEISF